MRVVAGTKKGRELAAPKGRGTRPTLAKVKEAMFGMIQFDVEGASVLDLFSGSGALGIEALSRGAARAVFCDADRQAAGVVRANLAKLELEGVSTLYCCDALALLNVLEAEGSKFDIVLLDPPYETELASKALALLCEKELLSEGALILCEHSRDNPPAVPGACAARKAKKYGDSYVTLITYSKSEATV